MSSAAMLSVSSLLNPAPSGPQPLPSSQQLPSPAFLGISHFRNAQPPGPPTSLSNYTTSTPATTSPATSFRTPSPGMESRHGLIRKPIVSKDYNGFTKAKPKGVVNFHPYECSASGIDEVARREVIKYRIYPFGEMQEYCRHIPYNSGKKDFFEKTGRESFEVFQYQFKLPGEEGEYHVMWDYNVGLVRMTPFFKCCKYSKTMPAKMLNLNPGLRDITHSITGGSIMAQGYWMPFSCARAVCATFCHGIAGALIPIFGPNFPQECIPPDNPDFGRMVVDPAIVVEAAREAEQFRRLYSSAGHGHGMGQQMGHAGYPGQNGNGYANGHPMGQMRYLQSVHQQPTSAPNLALLSPSSSLSPKSPRSGYNNMRMAYSSNSYPPTTIRDRRFHTSFSRKPSLALDIAPPVYSDSDCSPYSEPNGHGGSASDSPLRYGFQGAGYRPPGPPTTFSGGGSGWAAANHPVQHHPNGNGYRPERPYHDQRPHSYHPRPPSPEREQPVLPVPVVQPPPPHHYHQRRPAYSDPRAAHAYDRPDEHHPHPTSTHPSPDYCKYPTPTSTSNTGKRSAADTSDDDADGEFDDSVTEGSPPGGSPDDERRAKKIRVADDDGDDHHGSQGSNGSEKNAALLLMHLSVRDTRAEDRGVAEKGDGDDGREQGRGTEAPGSPATELHRSKRRRATSM